MSASLPVRPHLDWYRKAAKKKLAELREGKPLLKLADAQLAVAREHGHASWRKLKDAIEVASRVNLPHVFRDVMKGIVARDVARVRELLKTAPGAVNLTGPHPNWGGRPQPLHVSIECDAEEIFHLLLDLGADPSGENSTYDGWSPLMLAVHWKRAWARECLLARGAKVGLIEALMMGDDARAFALVESDPKLLTVDIPNDGTPLHFARTESAARRLLAMGVSPSARDKYGRTALDVASENELKPVMELLLAHAANPKRLNRYERKAIDLAKPNKKPSIKKFL